MRNPCPVGCSRPATRQVMSADCLLLPPRGFCTDGYQPTCSMPLQSPIIFDARGHPWPIATCQIGGAAQASLHLLAAHLRCDRRSRLLRARSTRTIPSGGRVRDRVLNGESPPTYQSKLRPSTNGSSISRLLKHSTLTVPASLLARADEVIE